MHSIYRFFAFPFLILAAACGAPSESDQASDPSWWISFNAVTPRGHEELVRNAILVANDRLQAVGTTRADGTPFFPVPPFLDRGYTTDHPVTAGVFATDMPDLWNDRNDDPVQNLRLWAQDALGVPTDADWHSDGRLQLLHFLRPFEHTPSGTNLATLGETCTRGRTLIAALAEKSVALYTQSVKSPQTQDLSDADRSKNRTRALFWAGVAAHVIQDSFSTAHAVRGSDAKRTFSDICTYGVEQAGVCHHTEPLSGSDNIWKTTAPADTFTSLDDRLAALKPGAKDAVAATADFFRKLAFQYRIAEDSPFDPLLPIVTTDVRMAEYLLGIPPDGETAADWPGSGWFHCPDEGRKFYAPTTTYSFGASIDVVYAGWADVGATAYIGIVPASTPHSPMPLVGGQPPEPVQAFHAFDGGAQPSGVVEFLAQGAGKWQLRLLDSAGTERAVQDLTLEPGLKLPKTSFAPGEAFTFNFGADPTWPEKASILIVPKGTAGTLAASLDARVNGMFLKRLATGPVDVAAPAAAGDYEMRMFSQAPSAGAALPVAVAKFAVVAP